MENRRSSILNKERLIQGFGFGQARAISLGGVELLGAGEGSFLKKSCNHCLGTCKILHAAHDSIGEYSVAFIFRVRLILPTHNIDVLLIHLFLPLVWF